MFIQNFLFFSSSFTFTLKVLIFLNTFIINHIRTYRTISGRVLYHTTFPCCRNSWQRHSSHLHHSVVLEIFLQQLEKGAIYCVSTMTFLQPRILLQPLNSFCKHQVSILIYQLKSHGLVTILTILKRISVKIQIQNVHLQTFHQFKYVLS